MKNMNESKKIAIVVSQFNNIVTDRLLSGAVQTLSQSEIDDGNIVVYQVPGAFEIPRIVNLVSQKDEYSGVIALGAVVKGQTDHYQFISEAVTHQLVELATTAPVPVLFGVLTTDNLEQALNRAGGKAGNKGSECANALLRLLEVELQLN
ncbi:6,7-dimethyl-8-ribityllumazine synthase [Lentilactobacillus sp. SPB1-3]|uniref:6,7-dimethyl-8-ribityllumazine synthase n=1 Tax=Lentilactobacillus terminaliae TaxID=3003483 RepID=A0ACD5DFR6_9LACO|nr:6,7-dimethyl-8-ribityllumazine synthase [Lentilactobacillus sp. SPB1-3]MCZ0976406.1 6,7-dimethyl-8-ribityllumazine synthase [Lentilactobacillus sp. SPB1-3]